MMSIFCISNVKTNDEYRIVIKKRMNLMLGLMVIGIITAVISVMAEFFWEVAVNDHMLGVFTGMGVGLAAAGLVIWIVNKKILGNEEKIKEERLKNTDERLVEINNRALRSATWCLVIVMYLAALIGGLFYPVLVKFLLIEIGSFLLAYMVARRVYEKKI